MDDFDVVTNKAEGLDEKGRKWKDVESVPVFFEDGTYSHDQIVMDLDGTS